MFSIQMVVLLPKKFSLVSKWLASYSNGGSNIKLFTIYANLAIRVTALRFYLPGALFTKLTYIFDVSFGNFLLWNTLNFIT